MNRSATRRLPWPAFLLSFALLASLTAGAAAQPDSPEPGLPLGAAPPLAEDDVAVRFSVAPAGATDTKLTILTRWRSCGPQRERRTQEKRPLAVAHAEPSPDSIGIRVDVRAGPTDEACTADKLQRLRVVLDGPLAGRRIVDLSDDSYGPIINAADGPSTGLTYSCDSGYSGGTALTVPELLGPSLPQVAGLEMPGMRVVRVGEDAVLTLGDLQPNGRLQVQRWRWRGAEAGWIPQSAYRCELWADVSANQTTARWRLRGARPNRNSKALAVWVNEHVCNGRPLYGRIAQPVWINTGDGIVFVAASMFDTVDYEGTYIDDPWKRWAGKPGVATNGGSGSYAFVDCPGIGPGPYTFNLHQRLGKRKLYDGAFFPPRQRWP